MHTGRKCISGLPLHRWSDHNGHSHQNRNLELLNWCQKCLQKPRNVKKNAQISQFCIEQKDLYKCVPPLWSSIQLLNFWKVAGALTWIVTNKRGCHLISHFLDNFLLLERLCSDLKLFMNKFYEIMRKIGKPIAVRKTLGPTQILEYLGLILNFKKQTAGIPEKKWLKCLELIGKIISVHCSGKKVTVKLIQKTVGSLTFICQVLLAGWTFLVSLYRLTRTPEGALHKFRYHRRVSAKTMRDMEIFQSFLVDGAPDRVKTVPFLNKLKFFNTDL